MIAAPSAAYAKHGSAAPRLVDGLTGGNLMGLPPESSGPHGDDLACLAAAAAAGYHLIQGCDPAQVRSLGMLYASGDKVVFPHQVERVALNARDAGALICTLHLGSGLESDAQGCRLIEAVLGAQQRHGVVLAVETHRATLFQDMRRTVDFLRIFPDLAINADLSHFYTGQEMPYGDWAEKMDFLAPVFANVRFIHGRIGDSGCMQVDVGDGAPGKLRHVDHFRDMWTRCARGFLAHAPAGAILPFCPELLPARINYARTTLLPDGRLVESSDRWQQALVLRRIMHECFAVAQASAQKSL